jgi:glycosyltransferase involved in cell wall biosynthesis
MTDTPNILMACPGLPNPRCGIGRYTRDFVKALNLIGCQVTPYGGPLLGLYDRALECRPDLVHIQYEYGWASSSRLSIIRDLLRKEGIPLVATFHTAAEGAPQNRVLDRVILHGEFSSWFPKKSHVIPLAIPDIPPNTEALTLPRREGISRIGWFGNVFYHKGLDMAIRTYGNSDASELLVIGSEGINSESYYQKCRRLVEEASGRVYWYDRFMNDQDIVAHLATCDVLIFPYSEYGATGCSAAVRLAFNAEVPCMVSETSHFRDLLSLNPCPVMCMERNWAESLNYVASANRLRTEWSFPSIAMRTLTEVYCAQP